MKKLIILFAILILSQANIADASGVVAAKFVVDKSQSYIQFSGKHAGKEFKGEFEEWEAEIEFDANNLQESSVVVIIDTGSAKTGDAIYDGTLPNKDWFDVKNYQKSIFKSRKISKNGETTKGGTKKGETFTMIGDLTIKNITQAMQFDFALSSQVDDTQNTKTIAKFALPFSRLKFGIGVESDAEAEWVDDEIKLEVLVVSRPK